MELSLFEKIKLLGDVVGKILILLGVAFTLCEGSAWYFLFGFMVYWIINYGLIRGYIEAKYFKD